jgi:hypothetical protein
MGHGLLSVVVQHIMGGIVLNFLKEMSENDENDDPVVFGQRKGNLLQ